jgi:TDG/mug DNA glycosylase family protein
MRTLRDVVAPDLRLLFVGINPGLRSAQVGHHFAGPGNPFWRLLHAADLVGAPLASDEDRRLLELGLGITNLCPRATRSAAELRPDELAAGARALERKVRRLKPRAVALVGITLYKQLFRRGRDGGPGPKTETLGGAPVFVVPNPSGLNASFPGFEDKLVWFRQLRGWAQKIAA